jgi:integrase/recombinase XerD
MHQIMNKPTITLTFDEHRNHEVVSLRFAKDYKLIDQVKSIPGAWWSQSRKFWYIVKGDFNLGTVFDVLSPVAYLDYSAIKDMVKNTDDRNDEKNNTGKKTRDSKSDTTIKIDCNEKECTFYLTLPFALKEHFKKLEGAWWHGKKKQWSALDTPENRDQLREILVGAGLKPVYQTIEARSPKKVRTPKLIDPVQPDEKLLRHFIMENKAKSTIKQYTWYITWFLTHYRDKNLTEDPGELVKEFLHKQLLGSGYGKTAQNLALSALQNYYRIIYNIDLHTEGIPRPKQKRPLPKVLSVEEFEAIYRQCHNLKHKIILKLMYGCGLRRQEVCDLKTDDVDFKREIIFVKGKGSKFRPLNPGKRLLSDMKEYLEHENPGEYFIQGQKGGKYSGSSIAKIVERAATRAGIKREVTPHMFRHTFATHHMERGTELRLIQEALGHASSKTTEIYTRVSRTNIKKMPNLLDDLEI